MAISDKIKAMVALLSGMVHEDSSSGGAEMTKGTSGRVHVLPASETAGVLISDEIANPSTTQSTKVYASGLMNVGITLLNLSGSNVNYCYVVFDALDAADGATKLATVGTREVFKIGEVERIISFTTETPIYRLDVVSDIASGAIAGSAVLRISGKGVA